VKAESSSYGDDQTRWLDMSEILQSPFSTDYRVIDVSPYMTIKEVIRMLTGSDPVQSSGMIVTEYYLYCLSCSSDELDPEKQLLADPIEENDVLLLGVYERLAVDPWNYRATLFRDIIDFSRFVRERDDLEKLYETKPSGSFRIGEKKLLFEFPPVPKGVTDSFLASWSMGTYIHGAGVRPVEGLLLYTEEDKNIAEYIRLNFSNLDVMTGHHLNVYVLESPAKVRGTPPKDYWKAFLDQKQYSILNALGWTRTKPYAKEEAYKLGQMLGVLPDNFPCLMLFGDLASDEKIILSIGDDIKSFFRTVCSIIQKTMAELLQESGERMSGSWPTFNKFKEKFMSYWETLVIENSNGQSSSYTFNGNTVFINRPSGPVNLRDFQKGGEK
jgi:hypothetical protein